MSVLFGIQKCKRVAIGGVGSGTRSLALSPLGPNGTRPRRGTTHERPGGGGRRKALLEGTIDAVFLMGDFFKRPYMVMTNLLRNSDIGLALRATTG